MRKLLLLGLACTALAACDRQEEAPQATAGECPVLDSRQVAARGLDLGSGASVNGVGVSRERGSSSCRAEGAAVSCDLTDPGVTAIVPAEGAQAAYFDIPAGRNASITVSGGKAACTLS